jgi:hypothetical protein
MDENKNFHLQTESWQKILHETERCQGRVLPFPCSSRQVEHDTKYSISTSFEVSEYEKLSLHTPYYSF